MKDIKRIRWNFHSVAWVMSQGWDLGVPRGLGGVKILFSEIQPDLMCVSDLHKWHMYGTIIWVPAPWGLGEGPKGKIIIKSQLQSQFQRFFKPNWVYLLTNERYRVY